jgi:glycine dehydrogenase subunit 1
MLAAIGVKQFEELLKNIPPEIRLKDGLRLPEALSELEVVNELQTMTSQNKNLTEVVSFLGGGSYDHFIPAAIGTIISRSEFITAYTPYQAEVSQGTLQAIYEFQTMICRLTGMDVANASMYDGGSALAEAVLLAMGHTKRNEIVIAGQLHPHYLEVIRTICVRRDVSIKQTKLNEGVADLDDLRKSVSSATACVVVQHPNFFGCLEQVAEIGAVAHDVGALYVVSVDPISLGILAPPGDYGADVVTGEGQCLGIPTSFGGPYLGIFAVKEAIMRKIPGRLSGVTVDAEGKRGFVLTLQTREQQIRREKATSNICTNQGLMMLTATVYLALMGKQGIREVAELCVQKSHYLANEIAKIKGFKLKYATPFFKEFVVDTPIAPKEIVWRLSGRNIHGEPSRTILPGIDLTRFDGVTGGLLVSVTEKKTKAEMERLIEELKDL